MPKGPLFAHIAPSTASLLDGAARERRFAVGEDIIEQGRPPDELFVISEGRAKLTRTTDEGECHTLILVGQWEVVGNVAIAQDLPYSLTATATEEVRAQAWSAKVFREALRTDAALSAAFLQAVARRVQQLIERFDDTISVPVEERLARYLINLAGGAGCRQVDMSIRIEAKRHELAEAVFSTVPTVSRIMSRWRREDVIGGERGIVLVLDLEKLVRVARVHAD